MFHLGRPTSPDHHMAYTTNHMISTWLNVVNHRRSLECVCLPVIMRERLWIMHACIATSFQSVVYYWYSYNGSWHDKSSLSTSVLLASTLSIAVSCRVFVMLPQVITSLMNSCSIAAAPYCFSVAGPHCVWLLSWISACCWRQWGLRIILRDWPTTV